MARNAFGLEIYEIKDVVQDGSIRTVIRDMISPILHHLGISPTKTEKIIDECLTLAKKYSSIVEYEKSAHEILEREGVTKEIPKKLDNRAQIMYSQVKDFVLKGSILDLGCGDGRLGELLSKNFKVILSDVYEHSYVKKTVLQFKLFGSTDDIPFEDDSFENTLDLTVFHHSDVPIKTLKESHRVTKNNGRVLVIESVYGVDGKELLAEEREKVKSYLELDAEKQRKVNIFFDHFYNRIIHFSEDPKTKVNVPFNFNTPEGWKKIFEENGFVQEKVIHLGSDQPTVPEYHTLHILRVKK
ncbi:MAG: methyltransferase domain-containing protein [Candidatus Aenigmatarchaeota archaeon]